MTKFLSLAAALLSFCVLSQDARAGFTALIVTELGCIDSQVGGCEFSNTQGPYAVNKLFAEPGTLTLTGFASGQGPSQPFIETIDNMIGGSISAYEIMLSTNGVGIAAFADGADLHLLDPVLLNAPGNCGLTNANLGIRCTGLNVPFGGSFGVQFHLMAPAPVFTSFSLAQGPTSVPEPAPLALLGLGLGLAGLAASRRRLLN